MISSLHRRLHDALAAGDTEAALDALALMIQLAQAPMMLQEQAS